MFKKRDTLISLSFAPLILPVARCIVSVLHSSSPFAASAGCPVFTSVFSAFTCCPVSGPRQPTHIPAAAVFEKGTWNGMTCALLQWLLVLLLLSELGSSLL